jgi:hypothetical protein
LKSLGPEKAKGGSRRHDEPPTIVVSRDFYLARLAELTLGTSRN